MPRSTPLAPVHQARHGSFHRLLPPFLLMLLLTSAPWHTHALDPSPSAEVTVINDISSHFEVLAGVVAVLKQIGVAPRILFAGHAAGPQTMGLLSWLGDEGPRPEWQAIRQLSSEKMDSKVVMCISAEMAPQVCQDLVDRLRPSLLIIWVHRADTATPTSKILKIHPSFQLIALAPHVAALAHQRLRQPVTWNVPLAMYRPDQPCTTLACLSGFVVQGALRKYRSKAAAGFTRNYTQLWERMVQLKRQQQQRAAASSSGGGGGAGPAQRVRVCVLGKGGFRSHLEIPAEVDEDVEYLERLPYPEFWGRIHRSLALVPAFGMPVYYESRISSTILASLITGTPLIAEQKLLDTYTFLKPEHVFLRLEGEDEVQAMYRILGMPQGPIMMRRNALGALARQLNAGSASAFRALLTAHGVKVPG